MSIGTPNGILDITGATLRVSKMEFRQSTGFDTVLNNVARNTMLLMDETEQTTSNSWALKLPNAWVAEFHGYWASGSSGAPILFNFYNDSTSGTNGYTLSMNDTAISINYDGGSTLGSATLSSTLNNDAYRKVAVIFERSVFDVSIDGEHVFHFADSQLRDRVYDNNSGYVTFTHSSTDERKLKNLKFTNGDKWIREIDSSNIAYVGGNVGIGTTIPGTKLDVSGTVRGTHLIGDGSAISAIQSSNVSDFGSNVTRIGTLETDLGDNSSRITNLSSNLSDNSSRITALESGDISISGDKTFTGDIIFESNIHMNGGNVLVANTVNMTVSDPIIELGSNNLNTGDIGLVMTRHGASNSNVAVFFDESADALKLGYTLNGAGDSTLEFDSNALAVSVQGALTATSVSGDGSGLSSIQSSNVSDFASNVTRIGTLETDLDSNVTRIQTLETDLDSNVSRIGTLESGDLTIGGEKTFTSNIQVGTANLFVDTTTGRVGVGTVSPDSTLHVRGTGQTSQTSFDTSQTLGASIFAQSSDSVVGSGGSLVFGTYQGKFAAIKAGILDGTGNTTGNLQFMTRGATGDTTLTNRMTIARTGNVGIGTTSPGEKLEVSGNIKRSGATYTKAYTYTSVTANDNLYIGRFSIYAPPAKIDIHDSGSALGSGSRFSLARHYDKTPRVQGFENSYYTTYKFYYQVVNTSIYDVWFRPSRNGNYIIHVDATNFTDTTEPSSPTLTECDYGLFTADGKVGIGRASPGYPLDVSFAGDSGMALRSTTSHTSLNFFPNSGYSYLRFHEANGSTSVWLQAIAGGHLAIRPQGGSETVRFNANGNVGIGTASPGAKLDVNGNIGATHVSLGTTRYPTLGGNWLTIFSPTYNGAIGNNHPDPDGGILFTNQSSGGSFPWGYYMGVVKDVASTNGTTQRFDIGKSNDLNTSDYTSGADTLTPYLTIDNGNVGIGTTSPSTLLDVVGHPHTFIRKMAQAGTATNDYNHILGGPRPGTTSAGAVHFINGSARTSDGGTDTYTIRNDSGKLRLGNASFDTLLEGNVGIGTSSPTAKLHVNGAIYAPGHPVQYVGQNVNGTYTYSTSTTGYYIPPLNINITPKFSNSKIILHWTINGEADHNTVFRIYRSGTLIGYNNTSTAIWSGVAVPNYDQNQSSTPQNTVISWVDTPGTTSALNYQIFIQATWTGGSIPFYLNRTYNSSGNYNELTVSYKSAMEVAV